VLTEPVAYRLGQGKSTLGRVELAQKRDLLDTELKTNEVNGAR